MSLSLYSKTPSVTVLDNRGLAVRDITYHRHPETPDTTDERITRHQFDARGLPSQSADPRLYAAGLANFSYVPDLNGAPLRTQSADAGTTIALNDASGRAFLQVSNIGSGNDRTAAVTRTFQYEDAGLPGRLLSITEQGKVSERFIWSGNSVDEQSHNLASQLVSHYDPAGLLSTTSISLNGVPLAVTRQLLPDDAEADWQGADASAWNDLLAGETYTTLSTVDAAGNVLTTTDAKGNIQRVAYDVAGLLKGSWLTVSGGSEQVIVKSLTWSAAGQKLREEHGNGVVTTYSYEAETQRLVGIKTERMTPAKVLQDLRYEYDPVGNVLVITNDAEESRFWRNQEVVPENHYAYDSLYQLVSATGREMASAVQQNSNLPAYSSFDNATYTNYSRIYTYDNAGNLTKIQHSAPASGNNYTTSVTVSDRSNRAVLSTLTENPADVEALFTAGGQQKELLPGQSLLWTARQELQQVTPVTRDGAADDSERYRYDAASQRIVKITSQLTGNSTQTRRVVYLPGLELRSSATEELQVITVGVAGRAQVRVLHWESGQPAGISNDQIRYSYDNLTGSSSLEVDASGELISQEEYYPFGGTALFAARSQLEADYKTIRYSGKEQDATGLYYYGYRYYQPWAGRWLSADPAGGIDGLNLFRMVRNNPVTFHDADGLETNEDEIIMQLMQMKISKSDPKTIMDAIKRINPKQKDAHILVARYMKGTGAKNNAVSKSSSTSTEGEYDELTRMGALYLYSTNAGAYFINSAIKKELGVDINVPDSSTSLQEAKAEFKRTNKDYTFAPGADMSKIARLISRGKAVELMNAAANAEKRRGIATYYRGTKSGPLFDRIKPGELVKTNFLMSVTDSKRTAKNFASGKYSTNEGEENGIVYRIIGSPRVFQYGYGDEEEGIFPVGTKFKFTGISEGYYDFTEQSAKEIKSYKGTTYRLLR
ncbi:RHS repeat protein [Kosakonia sp. AG348]|uniref:RHS repeat protein n=1 Tax=Kosakonia sp. AG348 TaxID=2183906 RepID=UPI000DF98729|nr:RHS repeat domain-containing protein [Kosakonia sp. AG348]RCX04408.1 insecticidal toxin complex protein TccC [Kosakonia sp. AG348]